MEKITFYKWKVDTQTQKLINRIATILKVLLSERRELDLNLVDVASYGEVEHSPTDGWGIIFGKASHYVSGDRSYLKLMPSVEAIDTDKEPSARESVLASLKGLVKEIESPQKPSSAPEQLSMSVTVDDTRIGNDHLSDVVIPEDKIDYVRKVRELLGGGRVEIKKGDLHLIIE